MKADSVEPLDTIESATPSVRTNDLVALTKPRITLMVVITAAAGYLLAASSGLGYGLQPLLLVHAMVGTALVASGASALNQVLERQYDARMKRTADRPIPAGRLDPDIALLFGVVIGVGGLIYLWLAVNALTALLGAATLAGYLFIYTPMKRVSSLSTVVGAAPGAVPPMMGWTAVTDRIDTGAWALFALLFVWQLPHFLAIAWMYRSDYERGGYPMLPVLDPEGKATARQAILWAAVLVPISLLPSALGLTGVIYGVGAFLLGIGYLWTSIVFGRDPSSKTSKRLLLASVAYLPGILAVMFVDRVVALILARLA